MRIVSVASDAPGYDPERFVAVELLRAEQAAARVIRLSPGQALPAHTHASSDLFLYVIDGVATLETPDGPVVFDAGSLAHLRGDEELQVTNEGDQGVTMLAFLAPAFP